jgi:flavin-dependent dehydrogenase
MHALPRVGQTFDAVIVGARVAGAALAVHLACAGWKVALLDHDDAASTDAPATHLLFPDALHELDHLGVLTRLNAAHDLVPATFAWRVFESEICGRFTPVHGHDRCVSVRRSVLDAVLVETARQCSARVVPGTRVVSLIGSGTVADPVSGVVLRDGRSLSSRWVIGADGRESRVAHLLGLPAERIRNGNMEMLSAYWRGISTTQQCCIDFQSDGAMISAPLEDGFHIFSVAGAPGLARGGAGEIEQRYHDLLQRFPATVDGASLSRASRISGVSTMPLPMTRGHQRRPSGPGWALSGDASIFTHPILGQGIGDALRQSRHVAEDLLEGGSLLDYDMWRTTRTGLYEWSFLAADLPTRDDARLVAHLSRDSEARLRFLNVFAGKGSMEDVIARERVNRPRAAESLQRSTA